jgi:hypothetical protein
MADSVIPEEARDHFFMYELAVQSEFAMRAYGEINARLESGDHAIFAFAHMMLAAAANVSKILWPTRSAGSLGKRRGARLRATLEMTSGFPLEDRSARNYVDHFDERIDRFLAEAHDGVTIPRLVTGKLSSTLAIDGRTEMSARYLLAFETSSRTLSLCGDRCALPQLADALLDLQRRVIAAAPHISKGGLDLSALRAEAAS